MSKGVIKRLSQSIQANLLNNNHKEAVVLMAERDHLLVNGRQAPIPGKFLNQRQRRKRIRQNPHLAK